MGSGGMGGLGTARYFMHREGERIAAARRRQRERAAKNARRHERDAQREFVERIDDAEGDLGRALLLAMTVNRLLVRKGVLTVGEIAAVADEIDLSDGERDGKLHPRAAASSNEAGNA